MSNTIILRFRDLITEDDGTIQDHQNLISNFGEVWWGWWMKQDETPPNDLFAKLNEQINSEGSLKAFLFDSGTLKLYKTNILKILVAPLGFNIGTPNPETSPSYYHRGRYPAWFLLNSIEDASLDINTLKYISFPTRPEKAESLKPYLLKPISNLSELKDFNITLWEVE